MQQFTFYSDMTFLVDCCFGGFGISALVSDSGSVRDSFGPDTVFVFSTLDGVPFISSVGGCCICTSVVP